MNVLTGDVGGTKCILALCNERGRPMLDRRYESNEFREFHLVVRAFLSELKADPGFAPSQLPERACFAVAGPVVDDRCKATNLPWVIDARVLERELGLAKVRLVNDFYAQALAILELTPEDFEEIHPGNTVGGGPVAVLGAGTGLGEAFLISAHDRYEVVSSEGGHTDFAPTNDRQIELLRYLREQLGGRVSYERILSGPGLVNVYRFLRDRGYGLEQEVVREAMAVEDPAAVITRFAGGGPPAAPLAGAAGSAAGGAAAAAGAPRDGLCDTALELFCEVYGQEAGNLGLKVLATGGVYVCGGIAPRILHRLRDGTFQRAYCDKGRLRAIPTSIPVRVITNTKSGLIGASVAASRT
jgi:glucokinase